MVALGSGTGSDISSARSGTVPAARNTAVAAADAAYLLPPAAVEMIELATGFALTVAVRVQVANATGMKGWSHRRA